MKQLILFVLIFFTPLLFAAKDSEISPEQCRAASEQIIKISEDALTKAQNKKKAEKLNKQLIIWKKKLESGEDACKIYQSILKSSIDL